MYCSAILDDLATYNFRCAIPNSILSIEKYGIWKIMKFFVFVYFYIFFADSGINRI